MCGTFVAILRDGSVVTSGARMMGQRQHRETLAMVEGGRDAQPPGNLQTLLLRSMSLCPAMAQDPHP